jgi:O-antigen/teichoic acid export membrane protein
MISTVCRKAGFLATAGLIEYALQFLLPVILVRYLTKPEFGDYRLVWLVATTALIIFCLFMPQSLFYFLPRAATGDRSKLVGNAFGSLLFLGSTSVLLLLALLPIVPDSISGLQRYSPIVPLFVGLWVLASILDVLPTADGKAEWQAYAVIGFAILRVSALAGAAFLFGDIVLVLIIMCGLAAAKVGIAILYAFFSAKEPGLKFDTQLLGVQVKYSLPFAIAEGLFALRVQADQWVVAAYSSSTAVALISVAAVALTIGTLIRQPLKDALLPSISSLLKEDKIDAARQLIAESYLLLSFMLLPLLGLLIVTAGELVELIYTAEYLGAVPLLRIYLLGQMATIFAAGHFLQVFGYGRETVMIGALSLSLSLGISIIGIKLFGLMGAVAGSTISLVLWECWALKKIAGALETSLISLLRLDRVWRIGLVVASGMLLAHVVGSGLDASIVQRLVAKSVVFVATVLLGLVLTNEHQIVIPLFGRGGSVGLRRWRSRDNKLGGDSVSS